MGALNTVATTLLGRYVKGRWWHKNPAYVHPQGGFLSYTKKQLRELSDDQMRFWATRDMVGQVVAVTSEGSEEYKNLIFWILIDGKACPLQEGATVMPEGWVPEVPR